VVIENGQRQRPLPLAAGREHLEGAVVEIEMPQRADIFGLEAADLARLASVGSAGFAGMPGLGPGLAHQAVRLQIAADRGIGAQPSQRWLGLQ